jgi:hypothetical protein
MSQHQSKKDDKEGSLKDLVSFIKNQKPKTHSSLSTNRGPEMHHYTGELFSISHYALVGGMRPPFCTLIDTTLTLGDKSKKLTKHEMDKLYQFMLEKYTKKEFDYSPFPIDIGIIDGNHFDFHSNWGKLVFYISGGNSMPEGISELIDHIATIIK